MALISSCGCIVRTIQADALHKVRRCGALGLVKLASYLLRAAINLYQRHLISRQSMRVAVVATGRLEKSALALLLGPEDIRPRDDSKRE
jgi:hypothetical protein